MKTIKLNCTHCKTSFDKSLKEYNRSKSGNHFCSLKCSGAHRKKTITLVKCKQCSEETSNPLFCSNSCNRTYQNLNRTDKPGPKPSKLKFSNVHFTTCVSCNTPFSYRKNKRKYCDSCKSAGNFLPSGKLKSYSYNSPKALYRFHSKFKVSPKQYPHLFNSDLIKEYGWYSPSNSNNPNLTGVCWDHLFRIEEGFKNDIPTSIMSHPANAELIPWKDNVMRKKSMITLSELYQRIEEWDKGNIHLPTFYSK